MQNIQVLLKTLLTACMHPKRCCPCCFPLPLSVATQFSPSVSFLKIMVGPSWATDPKISRQTHVKTNTSSKDSTTIATATAVAVAAAAVVVGSTCVCRRARWCDFFAGMCCAPPELNLRFVFASVFTSKIMRQPAGYTVQKKC